MVFRFNVCFVIEECSAQLESWSRHFETMQWLTTTKITTDTNVLEDASVTSECVVICASENWFQKMKTWLETRCTLLSIADDQISSNMYLFERRKENSTVQHVLLMPAQCVNEGKDTLMMSTEILLNNVLSAHPNSTNLMLPRVDYINLDRRTDRKATFETSMCEAGVRIENLHRFDAIAHRHGCVGCTQSHIAVLKRALQLRLPFVVVCEDDCVWKSHDNTARFVKQCRDFVLHCGEEWDVLLLAASVHHFKSTATEVPNLHRVTEAQTTTAYVVNGDYIPKLLQNFETSERQLREAIEECTTTGQKIGDAKRRYSLDIYWKKLQREDRWFVFLPAYFRQQQNEFSDIVKRKVSYSFV